MVQFDVYTNPSKKGSQAYPFIVDIQNSIIDGLSTRLVIPLTHQKFLQGRTAPILTPQLTSMPAHLLKEPIGSIESLRDTVIDTIDFAVT